MSDYDIIMQAVGPTLDAYFPQREPDGPLPEERDQPDDRAEMEQQMLSDLYRLYQDAIGWYGAVLGREFSEETYEAAARIALGLGLGKEWLKIIEEKK